MKPQVATIELIHEVVVKPWVASPKLIHEVVKPHVATPELIHEYGCETLGCYS